MSIAPENLGMRVTVTFHPDRRRPRTILRNVTEIHYGCDRALNEPQGRIYVAFESDVHGTGCVWDLAVARIVEFETALETERAEAF